MNNSWKVYKFSDAPISIIDGDRGKNYPKRNEFSEEGYCLFLNANNVTKEGFSFNSKQFITKEKDELLRSGKLSRGDVVMTTRGTIGNVAYYGNRVPFEHVRINSGMVIFRCERNKILPLFLFQYLRSPIFQAQINAFRSGVAQPQLPICDIKRMSISIPSLPEQYVITSILSAYDDLIENNTRRIQILEEMAQRIYQEWFVNFRFPGHEKVRFVNSELGKIPEGWEVKPLEDIADLYRGKSYRSSDLQGNNCLPFFNLKNIQKGGGFRYEGTKLFSGKFSEEQTAHTGDILIAVTDMTQERNVVARVARVPKLKFDFGVFSMDLVRIEPKGDISKDWLYCLLRYSTFSDEVKEYANGVNVLHLSPDRIKEYRVLVPANGLQKQFGQIIKNIFLLIDNFYEKNENLKKTRDLLLPKLISGELDVSNLDIAIRGQEE